MRRRARLLWAAVIAVPVLVASMLLAAPAWAHGAMMQPGSRTFLCYEDGLTSSGEIVPKNPACAAAVDQSGANSLYNWFGVLRSDGAGRTQGFIPDGQLCSGGNTKYSGFDLPSTDWPVTHLTSGASFNFRYNKWAAHPGTFYLYVTKDGWDPTKPLTWSELESTPFLTADHPADTGPVGSLDGYYYWTGNLPANKTGRHIIYSVWSRSDSTETFYGCSDVVFDGGNGQVTGVGTGSGSGGGTGGGSTGTCTASFSVVSSWSRGYQGQMTVKNSGTSTLNGWTVTWMPGSGQTIASSWNGTLTTNGDMVTMRNADYNRSIAAGASTTFGFTANGSGTPDATMISCSSP